MSSVTSSKHAKLLGCIIVLAIYRLNTFECHLSIEKRHSFMANRQKKKEIHHLNELRKKTTPTFSG